MAVHEDYFNATIERDFFHFMCGEMLGSGSFRDVYVFAHDPKWVVKIETGAQSFSNIREWDVWNDAGYIGESATKWLAPCKSISPCGTVLIQRRTKPAKTYPKMIPTWMTDTKRANFGMIGSKFVAHDYGLHQIYRSGMSKRLSKVEWWDD